MHGISEQTIINYADSRVNTSSSSSSYTNGYNSGYSNGKNVLSTLTSGEKAFIWLLFTPIALEGNASITIGAIVSEEYYYPANSYTYVFHPSLDLSKIASVNIFFNSHQRNLWWVDANNSNIVDIISNNNNISPNDVIINNVQVPSGAKGIKINSYQRAHFRIISFTTTDGKVHTADNLNY